MNLELSQKLPKPPEGTFWSLLYAAGESESIRISLCALKDRKELEAKNWKPPALGLMNGVFATLASEAQSILNARERRALLSSITGDYYALDEFEADIEEAA